MQNHTTSRRDNSVGIVSDRKGLGQYKRGLNSATTPWAVCMIAVTEAALKVDPRREIISDNTRGLYVWSS